MNRDEYYAAIEAYKQKRVEHGEWKKHKYIRIENGRYIYPEDVKKTSSVGQKTPVALGGRIEKPEYESHRERSDSYPTTESYQTEAKKLADARAAGRKATQEYKSSGQHEKDVAAEKNKKKFEESTKQLSPQEQYKEAEAEKAAAERKEADQKQALKDVKNRNIGMQIDRAGEKADQKKDAGTETPGMSKLRDMSADAQEKAKKAAEEKVQAKKNEYLELGKKNGLTDSDVDDFIKTAEYNYNWRKDTAMRHATSRAKDYGDDYTVKLEPHEHGSMEDIVIYRPDGSKMGKFVSIENLESDIQNQLSRGKESPYYKQKFHHSDPRAAFYAAVDEYKSKKELNQRVPL